MEVLDYLKQRGITPELKPEGISLRPKQKVTPEIVNFVKQHKAELIHSLQNTEEAYTYQGYNYDQLSQIFTVLLKQHGGYILVKSAILEEVIAFCLPQHLKALTKQGYTCYLPSELATLLIK